ncbi:MAG TPA: MopE-related protein [Methylomirabilota bacterium]|nr:MopE-related protein [Methylomirabilota bacterium]
MARSTAGREAKIVKIGMIVGALFLIDFVYCTVAAHATVLTDLSLKSASLIHDKQKTGSDKLAANGTFRLGPGNNGANPATESVTFTLGPFSLTIPPRFFKQTGAQQKKTWKYITLKHGLIKVVITNTGADWTFNVIATKLTLMLSTNPNPLSLSLSIGDDSGTSRQFFVINDTPKKLVLKFPAGKKDDADGDGFSLEEGDCDDQDPTTYPGAEELCDAIDNNCNKQIDEGAALTFFQDADGDGFGDPAHTAQGCSPPASFVENDQDCNDNAAAVHPGATELCNATDDNCDGAKDEGFDVGAACAAGVGACASNGVKVCAADGKSAMCNATPGTPTAEVCNNIDDNCNGQVDDGLGTISCGQGGCEHTVAACINGQPGLCTPGTPKAEICGNSIDEDCNGSDLTCVVTLDIAITGPANLSSTTLSTIAVTGTVDATATEVTCNGRPAGINANGFGGNVPLKEGSNIITCVAKDAAGNIGSASITVTLNSTPAARDHRFTTRWGHGDRRGGHRHGYGQ